jgi:hypothetical protein
MITVPAVLIQQFESGASVTGATPSGATFADTEETLYRGRIRKLTGLTDGGLVDTDIAAISCGYRVLQAQISLPGISAVAFHVYDHDGDKSSAGSVSLTSGDGYKEWLNNGVFIPPGFTFRAVGTGTLSGDGQIVFVFGNGWSPSMFEVSTVLGKSYMP